MSIKLIIYYDDHGKEEKEIVDFNRMKPTNPSLDNLGHSNWPFIFLFDASGLTLPYYIPIQSIKKINCNGETVEFDPENVIKEFRIYYNNLCVESKL